MDTENLKLFDVDERIQLKKFIEAKGLKFEKGCGFYQLTKKETIQDYKCVIARRKKDGQLVSGDGLREVLKIPKKSPTKVTVDQDAIPDFDIFVQSSSYNRVILPDTKILYKLSEAETKKEPVATKRKVALSETGEKDASQSPSKKKATVNSKAAGEKTGNNRGLVEVVFSFDTTGSMYACLAEVRRGIKEAIRRLKREVPGIRLAIIAHGDYCDTDTYVTKIQNFTEDEDTLCRFVSTVSATGGGDADECYELVLRETVTRLQWTPGSVRSLVMIGDCNPHGPKYPLNRQKIDWRTECATLRQEAIRVYAVQALNRKEATAFYRDLASLTDGFHLRLDQFSSIVAFMLAICFREEGGDTLDTYEEEVRGEKGMNREIHRLFDTLQGRAAAPGAGGDKEWRPETDRADGLVPINPSRFQVLHVPNKCSIKQFVLDNSLLFKTGRGFYEFTKPEVISHKKEVVLLDRGTGDMFTGQEACDLIGAGGAARVAPAALEKWRVFVQSTSYNRQLMADTGFLYEVDTEH